MAKSGHVVTLVMRYAFYLAPVKMCSLFLQALQVIAGVMKECLYHNSAARLTALRIKKKLATLNDLGT